MHGLQAMYIKKEGVPRQGRDILTRWWLLLISFSLLVVALETNYCCCQTHKNNVSSSLLFIHTYIHYLKQIHIHSISTSS
jgi:hypothetical protein